jgi:hypothetical protein
MRATPWLSVAALALTACQSEPKLPTHRAEIRKLTGSTVEIVPTEGQLPNCLVYTASDKGIVRQLTMNARNESITCEAGKPIRNTSFRIPVDEGRVRVFVIFSDRKLNAGSMAQQIYELLEKGTPNALDLRAPGQVVAERLEFVPKEDVEPPAVGGMVSPSGELANGGGLDAGS